MESVVVNDTNIFIDLISIDLLDEFFMLPIKVHTNDFVVNELSIKEQREQVLKYKKLDKLYIKKYTSDEISKISIFHKSCENNVSFTDCSIWLYTKQNSYRLLTGDNKLRKSAIAAGVRVSGILYIFKLLVENKLLGPITACKKLKELKRINDRLPSKEINNLISKWGK